MTPLYVIFKGEELPIAYKIQQRRYQLLVHSYIYYELNSNIVSDSKWSKWAMELVELQTKYPQIAEKVIYAEDFADWDGSSGAFLTYTNKPNIVKTANWLLDSKDCAPPTVLFAPAKPKNTQLFAPTQSKPGTNKPSTAKKKLF